MTGPFLLSISVFIFSFLHYFFCCGSVQQIKLAMLVFGRTLIYVVEIEIEISTRTLHFRSAEKSVLSDEIGVELGRRLGSPRTSWVGEVDVM